MTGNPDDWRAHAAILADRLTEHGAITDLAWRDVVAAMPRHVFVPEFYSGDDPPELLNAGDPRWLGLAYSDDTLVTQRKEHPDQPGFAWSTSSSTRPSLMLRMLHILDLRDGVTVLEIGTGTGYNAALLSERLGSGNVTTVDIDPELADAARARLTGAGYTPTIAAYDGPKGYPARAPYDRVIATVATEHVPYAWVRQTRPGTPESVPIDAATVHTRASQIGSQALHTSGLSLLIWQRLPGINAFPGPDGTEITTPDGSWAKATKTTPAKVDHGGPADIWKQVEQAHTWWIAHGSPDVETFGLTITSTRQRLWHKAHSRVVTVPGFGTAEGALSSIPSCG